LQEEYNNSEIQKNEDEEMEFADNEDNKND